MSNPSQHARTAATNLYNRFSSISLGPLDEGDTLAAYQARRIAERATVVQEAINATLRDLFLTMPVPPDDMGDLAGLEAYAEAIAEWRKAAGYPLVYDGPTGA